MSIFKSDGKTYDDRGRLFRHFHPSLTEELTNQTGPLIAVTENFIFNNNLDHVVDNNLNPVYDNQS